MFWFVLAAQVVEALVEPAPSSSIQSNIDVTVERLPAGLKSPTFIRVAFSVGADGRTSSCAAAQTKSAGGAENHPALVKIACAQIERGFRATAAKDATGKPIPSIRTAVFKFSTDAPIQAGSRPLRERPPYRGGPLDGIFVGEVMRPDNGLRIVGLKPSKPNASPVPAQDEPAIRAFIAAFEQRDISRLNGFLTKNAGQQVCGHGFYAPCGPKRPFSELKVAEKTTFNTPYYLGDHKVRLEWLFRGELWYWSEVDLSDGKIKLVRTHPADMPPDHP